MEKTFEDAIKQFSGFTHTKINMIKPMPMNTGLEYNRLTLMTGLNGTGKTLLNKLMWASYTFFNMKLVEKVTGIKDTEKSDTEVFQYIMDNTFDDQDFEGEFEYAMRDELLKVAFYSFKFEINDGKVSNLDFSWPDDAMYGGSATYLSKEARDFGFVERYLKMKKMMGIENLTGWADLEKLGEWFKLYDIFAVEQNLPKFEKAGEMLKMITAMGGGKELMGGMDLVDIKVDKEAGRLYYINSKNEQKGLTTLGAGEQSIVMMLMSAVQG